MGGIMTVDGQAVRERRARRGFAPQPMVTFDDIRLVP
jgi:hypothetical protein